MAEWPLVVEGDDGIRPAGPQDTCFYCRSRIGEPHKTDCVVVKKRVKVRYSFEIEVDMPHSWTTDDIEFHRNDGSWCADNAIDELREKANADGCLCDCFRCDVIAVVDDTPVRKVAPRD